MKAQIVLFFLSIITLNFWLNCEGHGYIQAPIVFRNTILDVTCRHCANGPDACGGGGGQWHRGSGGIVFDNSNQFPINEIRLGETIEFTILLTQTHRGHSVFELCRPTGSVITHDCFTTRLLRDPADERESPYLATDPHIFFHADGHGWCNGGRPLKVRFKVPEEFGTCEHCILRWFWQTGNSCSAHAATDNATAPAFMRNWRSDRDCFIPLIHKQASCGINCPTHLCRWEQFKNCADVRLVSGTPSLPPVNPLPPTSTTTTAPAPPAPSPPSQKRLVNCECGDESNANFECNCKDQNNNISTICRCKRNATSGSTCTCN